jgi:hypothetical protein
LHERRRSPSRELSAAGDAGSVCDFFEVQLPAIPKSNDAM